jgi:hypothetical protein
MRRLPLSIRWKEEENGKEWKLKAGGPNQVGMHLHQSLGEGQIEIDGT